MSNAAGKIFHSNENYSVVVNDDVTGYNLINDNSGVVEHTCDALPDAIFTAENFNVVLVHRTYEWVNKRAAEKHAAEMGATLAPVSSIQ